MDRFKLHVYAQQFLSECMPIYPFFAIMFGERGGLTTPQISFLFGLWTVVALLSELPTGVLADKFSRRSVMVAGEFLIALTFIIWIFIPNFWGYALGFTIWGIGYAFGSGAFEAYLYDELKGRGAEKQFNKIYGRAQSMLFLGAAIGFGSAIFIGAQNYTALLAASTGVTLLGTLLISLYPKEPKTLPHPEETIRPKYLKLALHEVRTSKIIARIVISTAVVLGVVETVAEYVPLYYNDVGIDKNGIPILMVIGMTLSAGLSWVAHRFEHSSVLLRLFIFGLAGGTLLIASFQNIAFAAVGMLLFMRLLYVAGLLFESSLQHHITSKTRATLTSLPNFLAEIIAVILYGAYGLAAYFGDDRFAIRLLAAVTVAAALGLALYWGKYIKNDNRITAASARLNEQ